MKKFLTICAALLFLFVTNSQAQTAAEKGKAVEFQQYDSYFVKNTFTMKGDKAFLVLKKQADFDKVFGAATRMKDNNFMPSNAFDSKIVVTTIKNGDLRKYSDVKVTSEKGKLTIWYTATDSPKSSATFQVPLILAVDKGNYKEAAFMENGKQAGSVKIK